MERGHSTRPKFVPEWLLRLRRRREVWHDTLAQNYLQRAGWVDSPYVENKFVGAGPRGDK